MATDGDLKDIRRRLDRTERDREVDSDKLTNHLIEARGSSTQLEELRDEVSEMKGEIKALRAVIKGNGQPGIEKLLVELEGRVFVFEKALEVIEKKAGMSFTVKVAVIGGVFTLAATLVTVVLKLAGVA